MEETTTKKDCTDPCVGDALFSAVKDRIDMTAHKRRVSTFFSILEELHVNVNERPSLKEVLDALEKEEEKVL